MGFVCAWNGTGVPGDQVCTAEYCIRKFPDSFQPQAICGFNGMSLLPGMGISADLQIVSDQQWNS